MIYIIVVLTILLILVVDCNTTGNAGYNTINDPNIILDFPPLTLILTDNDNSNHNSNHNTMTIDINKQNINDTNYNNVNNNIDTVANKDEIIRGEIWGLSSMKGISYYYQYY